MTTARHIVALLQSHIAGDDTRFLSVATQLAAHEARQGHGKLAQELKALVDVAKEQTSHISRRSTAAIPISQPKGEVSALLVAHYSDVRLRDMVVDAELSERIGRILREQRQQESLRAHGLSPRRKLLFVGPPGSGKTMTASVIAGELNLPIFTVLYDGLIGKLLGESAVRLKSIFDAMVMQRGVYFFDEFDAIGSQRLGSNDVAEMRRLLNSFLQFLENDASQSIIIAATNHPELLDRALFRRFDDVIAYDLPGEEIMLGIFRTHLASFDSSKLEWKAILDCAKGLSQADVARVADEVVKTSILDKESFISIKSLMSAITERKSTNF